MGKLMIWYGKDKLGDAIKKIGFNAVGKPVGLRPSEEMRKVAHPLNRKQRRINKRYSKSEASHDNP